jgi:glycosyltransferase involved in cell wall biosynthesis
VVLARRANLTTVATIHGASFLPFAHRYPWLVKAVLRRANLVTCLDQAVLRYIRLIAPDVRSEFVPNPVFVEDDLLPADSTDELVVFAGEIDLRKGADVLHRAWRIVAQRLPEARCVMVGPTTKFVPPIVDRLKVYPSLDPIEIRALLRKARVVALPSRAEGMPMILTEAMSLGRPFVSTPVGGIPDLAREGGILVSVGDEVGLAESLIDLLTDRDKARRIGERGRRFCLETRSVGVIDVRFRQLYSAVMGDRS